MGGMKSKVCDLLAKNIWSWCQDRTIWLSAAHIAGKSNVLADQQSRILHNDRTEWMLRKDIFVKILDLLGKCDIDLFASRLNKVTYIRVLAP